MSKEKLQKAEYSGELHIGEIEIPCYILEDGQRLLSQTGMIKSLGMSSGSAGKGGDRLSSFATGKGLKPFINNDTLDRITSPVKFMTSSGNIAYGYDATVLADICEAVLDAKEKGALQKQQEHIFRMAQILIRGFAKVGIIALVDEATGYQEVRARRALEQILEKFISDELQKWAKTFPDEFYENLYRLKGWYYYNPASVKRPSVIGKFTNDLIYERLAPGVLDELRKKNPTDSKGRRKQRHHQWLTEDVGHPRLREHIAAVLALMKASRKWDTFYRMMQQALPKQNENLELLLETKDGDIV